MIGKKLSLVSLLVLVVILLALTVPVFGAYYYQIPFRVYNNNTVTSYYNTTVLVDINNSLLQGYGYINASGRNTNLQSGAVDQTYSVTEPKVGLFVPSILHGQTLNYDYQLQHTPGQSGYPVGVGVDGNMTIVNDASMEPGNDFSIETEVFIDTSYEARKILLNKEEAFRIRVSAAGTITAGLADNDWPTEVLQEVTNQNIFPYFGANTRVGQRLDDFPASTILRVDVKQSGQVGTPAGTAYLRVRRVSDDSIIGTLGSIDIGSFSGWTTFDTTPVIVSTSEDIRVLFEFSGGDVNNRKGVCFQSTDVTEYGYKTAYNAGYTDDSTSDLTFRLYLENIDQPAGSVEVSATGVPTGEHTIGVGMDSPFLGMAVDADLELPVTTGLVFNDPLWQSECSSSPFNSIDATGVANTVSGAVWTLDEGYDFDGVDDYIEVAHDASQLLTTGGSVEAWIKPDSVGELDGRIVDKSNGLYGTDGYSFGVTSTNRAWFLIGDVGAGSIVFSADNSVIFGDGNWYHVMATWTDTGLVTIYINGAVSGTPGISADPAGITTTNALRIGNRSGATDRTFDGLIGESRLYNVELTPAEVLQNYNSTKSKYGTGGIYVYSTLESVPDNTNDWYLMDYVGGDGIFAVPYMNYFKFEQAGVQKCWIEPVLMINPDGVPDRSGNGNNGQINWGTNPAPIEVYIDGAESVAEYEAEGAEGEVPMVIPPAGGVSLVENPPDDLTGMPLYPLFLRTSASLEWSVATTYAVAWFIIAFALGVGGLVALGGAGGFLIGFGATTAFAGSTLVFPWWISLLGVMFIVFGLYVMRRG